MPIKFRCPQCRQAYAISSSKAGTSLECQKCGTKLKVPPADTTAEPPGSKAARAESSQDPRSPEFHRAYASLFDESEAVDTEIGSASTSAPQAPRRPLMSSTPTVAEPPDDVGERVRQSADAGEVFEDFEEFREVEVPPQAIESDAEVESAAATDVISGAAAGPRMFASRKPITADELDLTPMVDVVFQLLIFFMVTAAFGNQKTLDVPAPDPEENEKGTQVIQQDEFEDKQVLVHIDAHNQLTVDDEPLNETSIMRIADVLRSKRKSEILISAHELALHETVVKIVDAANEAQMQKIRLATERDGE